MKTRVFVIIFSCVLLLFGCNNPKPSPDLSSHQVKLYKSAVDIIDEYLDDTLDHRDANDQLSDIYDKIKSSDEDHSYLILTCSAYILSNEEKDREKIIETRNKIAELCGVKEYKED